MSAALDDFDLDAAWARRAQGDLRAFMEALAARLQSALPDRIDVDRRRDGLFSRASHVHEITINGPALRLRLVFEKGALAATRAKVVRGVVISTSELTVPEWMSAVRAEAKRVAADLSEASDSISDFL